jgi:uncharacterized protein (TIGR03000 family)
MSSKAFTVWSGPVLAAAALLTVGSGRAPGQARGVGGAHFAGPAPGVVSHAAAASPAITSGFRAPLPGAAYRSSSGYRSSYSSRYYNNSYRSNYPHVLYYPFGYYPLYDPKTQSGAAYHRWNSLFFGGLNYAGDYPQGLYPPSEGDPSAHIRVTLPAGARLWFNGAQTTSQGRVRHFKSPALKAGHRYAYRVRARWKKNGRTVTQTRKVVVTAGDYASLRFPLPPKTNGKSGGTKKGR